MRQSYMGKKEYIGCLLILILVYAWAIPGCGRKEGVFYAQTQDEQEADPELTEPSVGRDAKKSEGQEGCSAASGDGSGQEGEAAASEDGSGQEKKTAPDGAGAEADAQFCFVHICGAVAEPGVYRVPEGSRLYEVILAAGGLGEDACDYTVNQAQEVTDGMQIYIPTKEEAQDAGAFPGTAAEQAGEERTVDLNRATREQLMTLPGIGESRAEAIIAYREEHGGFSDTTELLKVRGIKQGIYEQVKDLIRV